MATDQEAKSARPNLLGWAAKRQAESKVAALEAYSVRCSQCASVLMLMLEEGLLHRRIWDVSRVLQVRHGLAALKHLGSTPDQTWP